MPPDAAKPAQVKLVHVMDFARKSKSRQAKLRASFDIAVASPSSAAFAIGVRIRRFRQLSDTFGRIVSAGQRTVLINCPEAYGKADAGNVFWPTILPANSCGEAVCRGKLFENPRVQCSIQRRMPPRGDVNIVHCALLAGAGVPLPKFARSPAAIPSANFGNEETSNLLTQHGFGSEVRMAKVRQ
jgi:hypothetical protein